MSQSVPLHGVHRGPGSIGPASLLVASADPIRLAGLSRVFEVQGHTVMRASTYQAGKQQLLGSRPVDLLVADVRLGAFNGLQLVVFGLSWRPGMPAVVIDVSDDPVLRQETSRLHATYCAYPIEGPELGRIAAGLLAERSGPTGRCGFPSVVSDRFLPS